MLDESRTRAVQRNLDQEMLVEFLWPVARLDMVAHDSYTCQFMPLKSDMTRPWPSPRANGPNFSDPRVNNYVGGIGRFFLDAKFPYAKKCPEKCRPKNHQDWIFC